MNEPINLKNVIKHASDEVRYKIYTDKMFRSDDESPESKDFTNGDPETLFTISSMYAQFVDGDFNYTSNEILCKLQEIFPEYI